MASSNNSKLEHGTDSLQVGSRLRHARQLESLKIKDLAEKVGCAESMISKIETGKVDPSLSMLQRLVHALGRDLSSFFSADARFQGIVQKQSERVITTTDALRGGKGIRYERLVPLGAGHLLEANVHIIEPDGEKSDTITHQGETLGYVIEGEIELTIEDQTYLLFEGHSFFFMNHLVSRYRNNGTSVARIIWVNTPQIH